MDTHTHRQNIHIHKIRIAKLRKNRREGTGGKGGRGEETV